MRLLVLILGFALMGCASSSQLRAHPTTREVGDASYYSTKHNGRRTANGEIYDETQFTAAHRTLPFGTKVRVTNLKNERSAVFRINDRGPFVKGRVVDVSKRGAKELDFLRQGIAHVKLEVVGY